MSTAQLAASEPAPSNLSWVEYGSLVIPFGVALLALLTKLVGLVVNEALVIGTPLAALGLALAIQADPLRPRRSESHLGPRSRPPRLRPPRWRAQALALGLIQLVVAVMLIRRLGTGLVPRAGSSDFGSHGGIVTWIVENRAMPSPARWPATLAAYPSGGHLAAGLASLLTPFEPLEALWGFTLLALIGTWPVLCLLARLVAVRRPWLTSALTLFFIFSAYRYTVGIVTYDYFFAQLTGQWLALSGVVRVVADLRRMHDSQPVHVDRADPNASIQRDNMSDQHKRETGRPRLAGLGIVAPSWVGIVLAGAVLSYPQSAVLLLGCIGSVLLFGPLPRRVRSWLMLGAVGTVALFLVVLSRTVYWNVQLLAGTPGEVAHIALADVGGQLGVGLAGVGLAFLLRSFVTKPWMAAFVGAAAGPICVVVAMLSLRAGFPVRVDVSDYRVAKNLYGLVPLGVVCAAIATAFCIGWIIDHLPKQRNLREITRLETRSETRAGTRSETARPALALSESWVLLLATGLLACFALGAVRSPTVAVRRIYDPDLYKLGRSLPEQQRTAVGLVAPWVEVYIMRWSGIGPPIDAAHPAEFPRTERWRAWPDPTAEAEYLLVSGPFAKRYSARPGVVIERRLGSAVLLKRAD